METKWASLVSYGMTVEALTDFLPLEVTLDVQTVRHTTLKVAERCEAELGEEHGSFIEGCPRDWGNLPMPDGPITVGIDGGVRARLGDQENPLRGYCGQEYPGVQAGGRRVSALQ